MNRSAIDIIIAISWAGKWITLSGESSLSKPSVNWFGVVVYVISDVPKISRISRTPMKAPRCRPSFVSFRNFHCQTTSPLVRKKLHNTVNARSIRIGRSPRSI